MLQGSFLSQLESYRKEKTRLCLSNKQTGPVGGWMVPGMAGWGSGREREMFESSYYKPAASYLSCK